MMSQAKPLLPSGYKQIEYIYRPSGTSNSAAYNQIGVRIDKTSDWEIRMGIMVTAKPTNSSGGYYLGCRQTNTGNTVGYGILSYQNLVTLSAFDGVVAPISANDGADIKNIKFDLVATKSPSGSTLSDGTHYGTNSNTSPRAIANDLDIFGVRTYNNSGLVMPGFGRMYYLNIKKNGTDVCNLIPCRRLSDNKVGMWDTVQEVFRTASYTAGPDV